MCVLAAGPDGGEESIGPGQQPERARYCQQKKAGVQVGDERFG